MRQLMRRNLYSVLTPFFITFSLSVHAAPLTNYIKDGYVHFYGKVVNAGCSVATDSQDQTVQMGQIRSNTFSSLGEWNDPHSFQIKLEDCSTDVTKTVGIMFTGESDGKDPLVFRTGNHAGASNGVGIGISDSLGHLLVPNTSPVKYSPLEEGETVLNYTARYRATSRNVIPGDASTQVWFSLYYQ